MKVSHHFKIPLALITACLINVSSAQIPAERTIDWTPGATVGVPGGIPNRQTIGVNVTSEPFLAKGDGATDDTDAIRQALASCPPHSVLYFPPGVYKILGRINATKDNITWRGAGMGLTTLQFHSSSPMYVGNGDWPVPVPSINITSGATRGSKTLTVDSSENIQVNKIITITQLNPSWVRYHPTYYGAGPTDDGHDKTRLMSITVKVTGKSGNTVAIEHPLPIDFENSPMITPWKYLVSGTGFESMTLDMENSSANSAIFWNQVYGCWIKDVEVSKAASRQFWLQHAVNCEIRSCYTHDTRGSAANTEGIDLYQNSCYNLIEDNICISAGYPMIILGDWGGGCSANVIAYNYCENIKSGSSVAGFAISDNHGPHNMFNLIEGNIAQNFASDGYYGSSSHGTIFRNYFSGQFDQSKYLWPYALHLGHWATQYSIVGNVLGHADVNSTYEVTTPSYSGLIPAIYRLGYPNIGNSSFSGIASNPDNAGSYDSNVSGTAIRHGNYIVRTNLTEWSASIPTTELPASLFRSQKPSYFQSASWPPIGPDVTPKISKIPAQLRYEQINDEPLPGVPLDPSDLVPSL